MSAECDSDQARGAVRDEGAGGREVRHQEASPAEATGAAGPAAAAPGVSAADREAVTDRPVFIVAALLALAIIVWGVALPENLLTVSETLLYDAVIPFGGWIFVLTASGFVVFAIGLAIS